MKADRTVHNYCQIPEQFKRLRTFRTFRNVLKPEGLSGLRRVAKESKPIVSDLGGDLEVYVLTEVKANKKM